jgi:hypothetical protein
MAVVAVSLLLSRLLGIGFCEVYRRNEEVLELVSWWNLDSRCLRRNYDH